jgi:hypothetical protein
MSHRGPDRGGARRRPRSQRAGSGRGRRPALRAGPCRGSTTEHSIILECAQAMKAWLALYDNLEAESADSPGHSCLGRRGRAVGWQGRLGAAARRRRDRCPARAGTARPGGDPQLGGGRAPAGGRRGYRGQGWPSGMQVCWQKSTSTRAQQCRPTRHSMVQVQVNCAAVGRGGAKTASEPRMARKPAILRMDLRIAHLRAGLARQQRRTIPIPLTTSMRHPC